MTNLRICGAVAITLAAIIQLSGYWCTNLSPTVSQRKSKLFWQENVILGGVFKNDTNKAEFGFQLEEKDTLSVQIHDVWLIESPERFLDTSVVHLYLRYLDYVIWAEEFTAHAWFSMDLAAGSYTLEIVNVHDPQDLRVFFTIEVYGNVDYRPLQPFGLWLILISFPIGGLGIWLGKDKSRKE